MECFSFVPSFLCIGLRRAILKTKNKLDVLTCYDKFYFLTSLMIIKYSDQ